MYVQTDLNMYLKYGKISTEIVTLLQTSQHFNRGLFIKMIYVELIRGNILSVANMLKVDGSFYQSKSAGLEANGFLLLLN